MHTIVRLFKATTHSQASTFQFIVPFLVYYIIKSHCHFIVQLFAYASQLYPDQITIAHYHSFIYSFVFIFFLHEHPLNNTFGSLFIDLTVYSLITLSCCVECNG